MSEREVGICSHNWPDVCCLVTVHKILLKHARSTLISLQRNIISSETSAGICENRWLDTQVIEHKTLQARCLAVGQTLMGSYLIPTTVDVPLDLAVNPWGIEERSRKFVWNDGDNRRKLITLANKADRQKRGHLTPGGGIHVGAGSGASEASLRARDHLCNETSLFGVCVSARMRSIGALEDPCFHGR